MKLIQQSPPNKFNKVKVRREHQQKGSAVGRGIIMWCQPEAYTNTMQVSTCSFSHSLKPIRVYSFLKNATYPIKSLLVALHLFVVINFVQVKYFFAIEAFIGLVGITWHHFYANSDMHRRHFRILIPISLSDILSIYRI